MGWDFSILTEHELANFLKMVRCFPIDTTKCICGSLFSTSFGLYMHCAKSMDQGGHYPTEQNESVEETSPTKNEDKVLEIDIESPEPVTQSEVEDQPESEVKVICHLSDFAFQVVDSNNLDEYFKYMNEANWQVIDLQPSEWRRNEITSARYVSRWMVKSSRMENMHESSN
jgi:hypothetical protein